MLFNSYLFILCFLPICIVGYFGLNRFSSVLGQMFLIGMSMWFYGYFDIEYLAVIITSIVVNYIISIFIRKTEKRKKCTVLLWGGIIFNLGILFYFKYFDFFVENICVLFQTDYTLKKILLPLGISFFTFQQVGFLVDTYKGEVPNYDFISYASFVTFFPQLIAGPIVSHDEIIPQFHDSSKKIMDWENLFKGIYIFALGLAKKVLLADNFGNAANWGFANIERLDTTNALISMLAYSIQLYFDFSGYCDMAIGIGKMFNIDLPLNFNSPYKALTIGEFWDRWHITLTRFFTKYVYIPLGGSKKGTVRTYINTLFVFLLSGLWHGANWTFVLWGICHGVFMIINRMFKSFFEKLHPALNWIITFGFVNIAFALFRADSIRDAKRFLYRIVILQFGQINENITNCFNLLELSLPFKKILSGYPQILLGAAFILALWIILGEKNAFERMQEAKPTVARLITTALLSVWCILSFSGVSTFLYFNF